MFRTLTSGLAVMMLFGTSMTASAASGRYDHTGSGGIKFSLSTNKRVTAVKGAPTTIINHGKQRLVEIDVVKGGLKAAAGQAGFEKANGQWVVPGRMGATSPVKKLELAGWKGLQATVSVGGSNAQGFHGALPVTRVVLSKGKRSVVIEAQGGAGNKTLKEVVNSLRFAD
jgi:hypothetical protein